MWEILRKNNKTIGICGSLHTYQSYPKDLNNIKFYLPDTFAAGSECFPDILSVFQDFNLKMVSQSARNVSKSINIKSGLKFLANAPELGLKLETALNVDKRLSPYKMLNFFIFNLCIKINTVVGQFGMFIFKLNLRVIF